MTQHSLIQKYSVTKSLLPHEGCSVTHLKQHSSHFLPLPPLLQEYSLCELFPNPQKQKCLWSHKLYGISNPKSLFWGKYSALRHSRFPRPGSLPQHKMPPQSRGTGYTDGNCQPGKAWSTDHGNPVPMIIKTAVQTHPAVHRWCKGLMCHYKPNCWAPNPAFCPVKVPEQSPDDPALNSACFPRVPWKPAKIHQSEQNSWEKHTEKGQSEKLHNRISCIQLLKFALKWWVDNPHQEWKCRNSFSNSWLQ